MAEEEFNPYTPPNPAAASRQAEAPGPLAHEAQPAPFSRGGRVSNGQVLWWLYFALCALVFGGNLWGFLRAMIAYQAWGVVFSQTTLTLVMQGLALLGLLCYLRRLPLLHSFLWGLICLAWLGMSIYAPAPAISYLSHHNALLFNWRVFSFVAVYLLRLPEIYALWRYSSSSSAIWNKPRIQWKTLAQRVMDAILSLRRA